jgi:mRNA interferase RelE/StbE
MFGRRPANRCESVLDYRILISASAAREFDNLPLAVQTRVRKTIDALAANPRPPGTMKIRGGVDLFRIRIGDYRVIFHVYDREKVVDIVHMRHRREAYQ